jgi:type II secretory pathway component PulF
MAGFLSRVSAAFSSTSLGRRRAEPVAAVAFSRKSFDYVAVSPTGTRHKGKMQAVSQRAVADALAADGWVPIEIAEHRSSGLNTDLTALLSGSGAVVKLTVPESAAFFRQISELLRAGVPISRAMAAIGQEAPPKIEQICTGIGERITSGVPLSEAMEAFPDAFDEVARAYIAAGEASGTLPEAMGRLAAILEKRNEMRLKIKAVTAYPKMVGGAIAIIVTAILLFLVPRYQEIYAEFGSELPLPTRILVGLSENILPVSADFTFPVPFFLSGADVSIIGILGRIVFALAVIMGTDALRNRSGKPAKLLGTIAKWGFVLAVTVFAGGYQVQWLSLLLWSVGIGTYVGVRMFLTSRVDSVSTARRIDTVRFRMPVFGPIVARSALFQWASTLGGTLASGVPLIRAVGLAGMTSGSNWHRLVATDLEDQVRAGKPLSEALSRHPDLYQPSVRAMISTGETTGDLSSMLENVARTTSAEVDSLVAGLSAKVEVALLLVMAVVVGGLLVALYLPIIQLASTVGGG